MAVSLLTLPKLIVPDDVKPVSINKPSQGCQRATVKCSKI
jgi:hypothetical protein